MREVREATGERAPQRRRQAVFITAKKTCGVNQQEEIHESTLYTIGFPIPRQKLRTVKL
jgi:hypothetical protein